MEETLLPEWIQENRGYFKEGNAGEWTPPSSLCVTWGTRNSSGPGGSGCWVYSAGDNLRAHSGGGGYGNVPNSLKTMNHNIQESLWTPRSINTTEEHQGTAESNFWKAVIKRKPYETNYWFLIRNNAGWRKMIPDGHMSLCKRMMYQKVVNMWNADSSSDCSYTRLRSCASFPGSTHIGSFSGQVWVVRLCPLVEKDTHCRSLSCLLTKTLILRTEE